MSVKDTIFEVHGNVFLMKDFAEYLYLLGYKKLELLETSVHSRIRLNTEKKLFENVYRVNSFDKYLLYHVDKDAEEVDNLLTGPNDNLTEARDEFFEFIGDLGMIPVGIKDIEVNEPEEIKTEGENLVFKDNQTLGKSQQVVEDLLGKAWVRDTTLYTGVWGPWSRGYSVKVTEPTIKEHETLDQILSGNSPKPKLGVKHNQGKLPIDTVLTKQFPKAVEALVQCSVYGHEKYNKNGEDEDWLNFKRVEGGSQTYADAAARHNQNKAEKDEESGLPHIFHKLWNTMAEVELWIELNNS